MMAVDDTPVKPITQEVDYILSNDSRQSLYQHACDLNEQISSKKMGRKRKHDKREQDPAYKAGLGSEMNVLCMKPMCWAPLVKRPRFLKDHYFEKHEEVVYFHCGPCGEEFKHSTDFNNHLRKVHQCRSYCSMLHFTVVDVGTGAKTGLPYPYMTDGSCWCEHIKDPARPWSELVSLGLVHPLPVAELNSGYEGYAPMPSLRTRASKDENSYVFKSRGKRTGASNQVGSDSDVIEDITHATVSGEEVIHANDVDSEDTLSLDGEISDDELIDDGDISDDELMDDGEISDDELEDVVAYEYVEQSSKLSDTKSGTSPITVTLKHTPGGIKGVAADGVARPSKRPRSSSKKVSKQRKRPRVEECISCKHGLSKNWFILNSGNPCCPNGYQIK